jgi:hypothetical protein
MELESIAPWVFLGGVVLTLIAALWLLIAAFRTRVWWGILCLIPPLFLLFVLFRWRRARWPFGALLLGLLLTAASFGMVWYAASQLGERDKIVKEDVDGKEVEGRHLTLTGWNKKNYASLAMKPDTVVLQMANPDVTDETLVYVLPMQGLYELDLNDTQITDRGLDLLKNLPHLKRLRLRGTKVTDEGLRQYLSQNTSLNRLEYSHGQAKPETIEAWEKGGDDRHALED